MKKIICSRKTSPPPPDEATLQVIRRLDEAKGAVDHLLYVRSRNKLSLNRTASIGREINELIKVLSYYLPHEN